MSGSRFASSPSPSMQRQAKHAFDCSPPPLFQEKKLLLLSWRQVESIEALNALPDNFIVDLSLNDINICNKSELHLIPIIGNKMKSLSIPISFNGLMICQQMMLLQCTPRDDALFLSKSSTVLQDVLNYMQSKLLKHYLHKSAYFQNRDAGNIVALISSFISLEKEQLRRNHLVEIPVGCDVSKLTHEFPVTFINPMFLVPYLPELAAFDLHT